MKYIVSDVNLIDVERGCAVEEHRDIVVDGGKIVRICAHGEADKSGCKVIDASGKFVVPGLINAHVHLFGTGMPSKILGGGSAQQKVLAFVKTKLGAKVLSALVASSAKKQLLSGVTTVRTVGDFYGSDIALKRKTDAGKGGAKGLRMLVSGMAITVPGGHGAGTFARTSDTVEGLVALVDEVVAEGADLVKICVTGGVMDAKKRGEPGEVKMTFEQVKAVCDRAHALGKKVAAHVQSTEGVRIAALGGVDTIEHGAAPDEESVKAIKERGGAFVVTYSPALPFARLSPDVTKMNEMCKFNSEIVLQGMSAGAKAAFDAGIDVGLGTDASCPFLHSIQHLARGRLRRQDARRRRGEGARDCDNRQCARAGHRRRDRFGRRGQERGSAHLEGRSAQRPSRAPRHRRNDGAGQIYQASPSVQDEEHRGAA